MKHLCWIGMEKVLLPTDCDYRDDSNPLHHLPKSIPQMVCFRKVSELVSHIYHAYPVHQIVALQ